MRKTIIALFVSSLLLATSPAAARETLRMGITQYPSTLHPLFEAMVAKSLVLGTSLRAITTQGPDWQLQCTLCTELPSFANGRAQKIALPDGKTGIAATYTLKDDLFWGDGTPVTTTDVLFAYDVGRHPEGGVSNQTFFAEDIARIERLDDKNFTVIFAKEACEFAALSDFYPLPAHLERDIFESDPKTYQNRSLYVTKPTTPGLWFGPYRVTATESGAALTLRRNSHWRGTTPAFTQVHIRVIENTGAMASSLLAGQIDYIAGELGLPLDQALGLAKRLPPGRFNVTYKPGLTYEHIDLPFDKPPFNDKRLRQALMYAMNRDAINEYIFAGQQPVAASNISPLDTVFTTAVTPYPHDPARAGALLDDAGWRMGADGLRRNDAGEVLRLTLSTTAGNASRELVQQVLQSDWHKIGIDVIIRNQPPRVLFGDTLSKRRFDGGIIYAWMSSPRNIPKTTLHSTMIPTADNNFAGQNYPGYANPVADRIIDDLSVVCTPAENQALWHDLQRLYAEDLPALPLFYRADAFFIPVWLTGVTPTGHMHPSTLWIENWRVTDAPQNKDNADAAPL